MTSSAARSPLGVPASDPETPWWADGPIPSVDHYLSSECFVAGALSTQEPFRSFHPAWCLPLARVALDALSEWEPDE